MEDFSNLFYSIEHLEETREHQIVVELRGTTRKVQKLKKRSINFREIIQEAERERKEYIFASEVSHKSPLKNKSPVDFLERNSPILAVKKKSPLPDKMYTKPM